MMMLPSDCPVIVPKVEVPSILCDDLSRILRQCGLRAVRDPAWFSAPIVMGDIEIHVLPFFGEQPLRSETPRSKMLRNWGNDVLHQDSTVYRLGPDRFGSVTRPVA